MSAPANRSQPALHALEKMPQVATASAASCRQQALPYEHIAACPYTSRPALPCKSSPPLRVHHQNFCNAYFQPFVRVSPPWDWYEIARTVFCSVFLLPARLLCFAVCVTMLWVVARVAAASPNHKSNLCQKTSDPFLLSKPPTPWRAFLLRLLAPIVRLMLFICFGVYRIRLEKRTSPPPQEDGNHTMKDPSNSSPKRLSSQHQLSAPPHPSMTLRPTVSPATDPQGELQASPRILVANHLGYLDICALFVTYHGSFVAKRDIATTPLLGAVAKAVHCIFVPSREPLTSSISDRVRTANSCRFNEHCAGCHFCLNRLIIFPEGTTTNGTSMIPFRTGAFFPGVPVLPVCIRFPHEHFNPSWETIPFREHLFRSFTQFRNDITLIEMPVYVPTVEERENPHLFAWNVQSLMAQVLDVPIVPLNRRHKLLYHSYLLGRVADQRALQAEADRITCDDELLQSFSRSPAD